METSPAMPASPRERARTSPSPGEDRAGEAFELVVRCAWPRRAEAGEERIRSLLAGQPDWNAVQRVAGYHQMRPLLYRTLKTVAPEAVPAGVMETLARQARNTAAFNTFLATELVRLRGRLEQEGIPVLTLKGPAVALLAYGDLSLRPFVDLDLLIRPADYPALERMLLEEGYTLFRRHAARSPVMQRVHLLLSRQAPFTRGGVFNLDVHTHIMPPLYHYTPRFEELRGRAVRLAMGNGEVPGLHPEDLVLMLCFHGEKNRWETLKYVCDLAWLIERHPELDWSRILQRADRTQGRRILLLGLELARHYYDVALPETVREAIRRDGKVDGLRRHITGRLPRQHELGVAPFGERMRLHMALQNALRTKARYLFFALVRRVVDFEA
ncbi:MAG: hypothetical protein D6746_17250 [Bacteroidetes bacterium]|nr:MAG: hypothetical protein D6746_17250 [Bacteroidota bacterium]